MPPRETIILASASPRRAELLKRAGIPFEVRVSPVKEPSKKPSIIPTHIWPATLAYMKAVAVQHELGLKHHRLGDLILAADTIVVTTSGQILNKPANRAHARQMLKALSGDPHFVITGLCLLRNKRIRLTNATATCKFKRLSPSRLTAYLDSNLWKGKAGAYGIQDDLPGGDPFVTLLDGDITTVIGLPISLVQSELATFPKE